MNYFSTTHELVNIEKNIAIIGISSYAKKELGDIVFIEITKNIQDKIKCNEKFASIESMKSVSDIQSPISGIIIQINNKLINKPEDLNKNEKDLNWIIKVNLDKNNQLDKLMNEIEYQNYISTFMPNTE